MTSSNSNPDLSSFTFRPQAQKDAVKQIALEVEAIEARIVRLVEQATLGDNVVAEVLVKMAKDPKELNVLGKALTRISELLPRLYELKEKKKIIELVENNPTWLAAVFGDFTVPDDPSGL